MVVFNGEKGCWPREDLKDAFGGRSAWRYLNSGFFCGLSDRILAILEAMDIERIGFDPPGGPYPNDQGEYQRLYAEQGIHGVPMAVDGECEVSQTLSACELAEFDFDVPVWKNLETHTCPGIWHMNGGAKEIFGPTIFGKMGL
jgi:hypothetical protein